MNQKELNEIRRRFRPERNAISRIYGCYVSSSKGIISYIDTSLGFLPEDEQNAYLGLLKKSLSGSLGKNLLDIEFSTRQVVDGEEHHLLQKLWQSDLKDDTAREMLYQKIIDSVNMGDSNFLILIAADAYDVPHRGKDDTVLPDGSDQMFRYFVCSICPVKDPTLNLRFVMEENAFHSCSSGNIVSAPAVGFMFPCFDDRAANIYNLLYYAHKPDEIHQELIDTLFRVEPPMSAVEQRNVFDSALCDTLDDDCSYDVVQSVHEQIRGRLEDHKESRNPEQLDLSIAEVGGILSRSGVSQEKVQAFQEECQKQYGDDAALTAANIIESKKFEVCTPDVKISVSPENSYLIETRVINGRPYIMIPADGGVEVNGIAVSITDN